MKVLLMLSLLFSFSVLAKDRKAIGDTVRKEVVEVFQVNEKLHYAFFNYSGNEVEKVSKNLSQTIDKISDKEIAGKLKFAKESLINIKAGNDRKENDVIYSRISLALIHILENYDLGPGYNIYYCPMVKKKWVQNSKKIDKVHNPYAPWMKHCGEKQSDY